MADFKLSDLEHAAISNAYADCAARTGLVQTLTNQLAALQADLDAATALCAADAARVQAFAADVVKRNGVDCKDLDAVQCVKQDDATFLVTVKQ